MRRSSLREPRPNLSGRPANISYRNKISLGYQGHHLFEDNVRFPVASDLRKILHIPGLIHEVFSRTH